jgi:hypothetical protein
MAGLSLSVLRVGHRYRLINFSEVHEFEIERSLADADFAVKDIHTLERYTLKEITRFGKGPDFEIRELENNFD